MLVSSVDSKPPDQGFLTAERANLSVSLFEDTDRVHGVLVGRFELGIRLGLALEIHLAEHVQRRFLTSTTGTGTGFALQGAGKLPAVLIAAEAERLAVLEETEISTDNVIHVEVKRRT